VIITEQHNACATAQRARLRQLRPSRLADHDAAVRGDTLRRHARLNTPAPNRLANDAQPNQFTSSVDSRA